MRLIALHFQGLGPYAGRAPSISRLWIRSRMFLIDGGGGVELKGPDTDYQCPGGIIGFDNCSNAGYGSAEIIRPTDIKGKKKPDSSRPYLCFLAEHMNVPPTDDAVYYLQE